MKIIITESQNYILRRIQQLNDIVENEINSFKINENPILNREWCKGYKSADSFFKEKCDLSIHEFISQNWNFLHIGSDENISMLNKIVEENYGNYIRNLFHSKCQ